MARIGSERRKSIVDESSKTRKAREKLKRKLAYLDQPITSQDLQKKTIEIHRWISRHASQRVALRSKSISLFDENQHAARLSRKVAAFAEQLHSKIFPKK